MDIKEFLNKPQKSLVSASTTFNTIKRMYSKDKTPHLRTEIVILSPISNEKKDLFREMLFRQKLGDVLIDINKEIEDVLGENFDADIEMIYTSAKNL